MIGLISDTHGLLREEVVYNLSKCNLIIHTGDIGKFEVIENLDNPELKQEFGEIKEYKGKMKDYLKENGHKTVDPEYQKMKKQLL